MAKADNLQNAIKWCSKMKNAPRDAVNIFAFEVFKRVVMRTPVDTGQARQNWLVTVNQETNSVVRSGEKVTKKTYKRGKNKGQTIENRSQIWTTSAADADLSSEKGLSVLRDGSNSILNTKGDDKIIIQNNLPYIGVLEFGRVNGVKNPVKTTPQGRSLQAPNGMVGVTLGKAPLLWDRAVKAAIGGRD